MADAAQTIATVISSAGGLAIITGLARFIWKWRTGRVTEERIRNTSIVMDRVKAIEERDLADEKRRKMADEVSRLRRLLIENGIDPGDEPDIAQTITRKKKGKP